MNLKSSIILALLITLVVGTFLFLPEPQLAVKPKKTNESTTKEAPKEVSTNFIIRNVRLFDGDEAFENIDVEVVNNKINRIAVNLTNKKELSELDATGKTLIPGLIDSHTHAWGNALKEALNFGVTTELDMFTMPDFSQPQRKLRKQINNNQQADLFSSTILATAPDGHGTEYGFNIPVLTSVSQVEQFVQQRIAQGADYIKAVYNAEESILQHFPSISTDILAALIQSAHQHNKMLVVHVDNLISAKQAIALGADGIVHSFVDKLVDDELVNLMLKNNAFIIPTLSVLYTMVGGESSTGQLIKKQITQKQTSQYLTKNQKQQLNAGFPDFGIPKEAFQLALRSINKLAQAGIPIFAGSDAPNPGTSHGITLHTELNWLVRAGLTPLQALHSATGAARKLFPIEQRGTLQVGAPASMLLLSGNPLTDITQTLNIANIWKNGVMFTREKYQDQQQSNTPLTAGLISDFNLDTKETAFGLGIASTTDAYVGGKSTVTISLTTKNAEVEDKYIHVNGEVNQGFIFPWSGFAFIPGKSQKEGANFENIHYLVFDAKTDDSTKDFSVLFFEQGNFQPRERKIKLSGQWKTHKIPLTNFPNFNIKAVSNISFVKSKNKGEFAFMIDNIRLE